MPLEARRGGTAHTRSSQPSGSRLHGAAPAVSWRVRFTRAQGHLATVELAIGNGEDVLVPVGAQHEVGTRLHVRREVEGLTAVVADVPGADPWHGGPSARFRRL